MACRVILPNCVDGSVREFGNSQEWSSERHAKMDAAFEAYVGLYRAGLINDNLLPYANVEEEDEIYRKIEKRPNMVLVNPLHDPWQRIAALWSPGNPTYHTMMEIWNGPDLQLSARLVLSCALVSIESFKLYVDPGTEYEVRFSHLNSAGSEYAHESLAFIHDYTKTLLYSSFRSRMTWARDGFPLLFAPTYELTAQLVDSVQKTTPAKEYILSEFREHDHGWLRDVDGQPHHLESVETIDEVPPNGDDAPCSVKLRASRVSKRIDYLHPVLSQGNTKPTAPVLLDPAQCTVDALPGSHSRLAAFYPSILHKVTIAFIVESLCSSILAPVGFSDKSLVLTAISAPVAREGVDYQRLEFLGDAILKYYTAVSLTAEHLNYHEGYLAHLKDHVVSNRALAIAAVDIGLDGYILRNMFKSHKWRPLYNADLVDKPPSAQIELSTKVLADVIEALIGAAYLDGGEPKLLACLNTLLPKAQWTTLSARHQALLAAVPQLSPPIPQTISHLEALTGHTFSHPAVILEALTHPSHISSTHSPSYQRLEFLGDAVLDQIVTTTICRGNTNHSSCEIPVSRMHLLRSATVNADFLAFLALAHTISMPITDIIPPPMASSPLSSPMKYRPESLSASSVHSPPTTTRSAVELSVLSLLRRSPSVDISMALGSTINRFKVLQPTISSSLEEGNVYPWTGLAALAPEKLVSDLVESVLGAIYVDTAGNMDACEKWLEKLGVLPWLRRALAMEREGEAKMGVWHPKEELGVVASKLHSDGQGKYKVMEYEVSVETKSGSSQKLQHVDADEERKAEGEAAREGKGDDVDGGRYLCRLKVAGEEVAAARGSSRKVAETKAAELALPLLRAQLEARAVPGTGSQATGDREVLATPAAMAEGVATALDDEHEDVGEEAGEDKVRL